MRFRFHLFLVSPTQRRFTKTKFSFSSQYHVVGSKLQHATIRAGNPAEGTAAGDEETLGPSAGATAAAENQTQHHHRRCDIVSDEQTHPHHPQPDDAELD